MFAKEWEKLGLQAHFAKEMFYKVLLESYFTQYEKIIVSDVDVLFLGDVSKSFVNFDINSSDLIAGVRANNTKWTQNLKGWALGYKNFNPPELEALKNGIGGGYLIANLREWRKNNIESKLIDFIINNASKLLQAEQDALNIICYPNIATLSPAHIVGHQMWRVYGKNWESYTPEFYSKEELNDARKNTIQLHYIGEKKPWNYPSESKSDLWYQYLAKTTFLKIHLESLENVIIGNYMKTTLPYRIKKFIKNNPLFFINPKICFKLSKRIILKLTKKGK